MEFNLADLFENAVDHFGDRECVVGNGKTRTFKELEERANRLAHHLAAQGVVPGDHVGIYAYNCVEWVECLWAIVKIRAVWININYRYVEEELEYLFDNADLAALVYQREFAARVAAVNRAMPMLRHTIVIEDDSGVDLCDLESADYEQALAANSPVRDFGPRSPDDLYVLFTGGTTGMPKGVVWRQEDVFFALGGGNDAQTGQRAERPEEMAERNLEVPQQTFLSIASLMHGASQWSVMGGSFVGRKNVLIDNFEPHAVWRLVEEQKINSLMITGDAMGRPLAEALEEDGASYDISSLFVVVSSAAVFSAGVKDKFFDHLPNLIIIDSIGSSESGNNGMAIITKGNTVMKGGGPTVKAGANTLVIDPETFAPVKPGSGVVGKVARKGDIPLRYYKDPVKSAETFVLGPDGTRYAMPGDFALLEEDGSITLLGRGSVSINSGGEKIFPEEVESAVKSHPDAYDCVVVGVPDERFGSRVAAVVEPREGATPTLESIQAQCRSKIAGYKLPRELHLVDKIVRSPSGKPDYRWARETALAESGE
jgi:acyl-CoA synthetase (AMP-forming)/AMP-acid ligase II